MSSIDTEREPVLISTGKVTLPGLLDLPTRAGALIIIANGLGRLQRPIAESFASSFNDAGFATLLFNVLTPDELQFDSRTAHFSADSQFQSERLLDVVEWVHHNPSTNGLGIVGAAFGAAARGLLRAAGSNPAAFRALMIDGGVRRGDVPPDLIVPTLLLVDDDPIPLKSARGVLDALHGEKRMEIVPAAVISGPIDPFFSDLSARIGVMWLRKLLRG